MATVISKGIWEAVNIDGATYYVSGHTSMAAPQSPHDSNSTIVLGGAVVSALPGAVLAGLTVQSGGVLDIVSGAVGYDLKVLAGGHISATSGTVISGLVLSSGSINNIATFNTVTNYTNDTFTHTIPNSTTGAANQYLPIDSRTHVTSVSINVAIHSTSSQGLQFFALQANFEDGAWAHGGQQILGPKPYRINWGGLVSTADDKTGYSLNDPQALAYLQNSLPQYVSTNFTVGKTYTYSITRGAQVTFLPGYYTKIEGHQVYYVNHARTMWEWNFSVTPTDASSAPVTQTIYASLPYISWAAYWNENFTNYQPVSEWTNLKVFSQDDLVPVVSKTLSGNSKSPVWSNSTIISGSRVSGKTLVVSSGQVFNSSWIQSGSVSIHSGGVTSASTVYAGGSITAASGGIALGDSVFTGGKVVVLSSGIAERGTIMSGGSIVVSSGGNAVSNILSGGSETVLSGAHVAWETILSGAKLTVSSGGMAGGSIVSSGGTLAALDGAVVRGDTISASGKMELAGVASGTKVLSGGTVRIVGGTLRDATFTGGALVLVSGTGQNNVFSGGKLTLSGGVSFNNKYYSGTVATVMSGANFRQETLFSGATLTVSSGGISFNNTLSGGIESVMSGGVVTSQRVLSGATLVLSSGAVADKTFLASGAMLDFRGLHYAPGATAFINSAGILTVSAAGQTVSTALAGQYSSGPIDIMDDGAGGIKVQVCFLAGTLIHTPSGLIPVQSLHVGDDILTWCPVKNLSTITRLVWVGTKHCNVRPELADDEAGYPVRILKNSLSDGVPFKDLLITGEHCLLLHGKFVPARMLVNGRSIFFDKTILSYDYYHIETAQHAVVMADGALTESYLDTGNRGSFSKQNKVVSIDKAVSRNLTWADAAAPLDVSRDFVEPIFNAISTRAEQGKLPARTLPVVLTQDMNLHLTIDNGSVIRPVREVNGHAVFVLPPDVETVRIVSNISRPSDVIGPFVDDRRALGILIGDITLFQGGTPYAVTEHLTDASLTGWHTIEEPNARWTAGSALLPMQRHQLKGLSFLTIQVKAAGPYVVRDKHALIKLMA